VLITFSEPIDQSFDPAEAISFRDGIWERIWVDDSTVSCTLQSAASLGSSWSQVEVVPGTGGVLTRTLDVTGNEGHFRVVTSAP